MSSECGRLERPGMPELEALNYIAMALDPFAGCRANGDFGKRLRALAALRHDGLIDHAGRLTALGRAALAAFSARPSRSQGCAWHPHV